MANKPLISICMPVLNGEYFLPQALDSLLAQDYQNLEIIILDDLSTDDTRNICEKYAKRDSRIRYILDDTHRISHDAANHLASYIRGEYFMLACDDDLWEPEYISKLVAVLDDHPEVGLAYCNFDYIDIKGVPTNKRSLRNNQFYKVDNSKFYNFWHYVGSRHIVAMIFGIFRAPEYRKALPFDTFDETIADVDNLFMLKFLSISKSHAIKDVLFHYRDKYRWADPDILTNYPKNSGPIMVWIYWVEHQLRFTRKILDVINVSDFSVLQKSLLWFRTVSFFVIRVTYWEFRAKVAQLLRKTVRTKPLVHTPDIPAAIRHKALLAAAERATSEAGRSGTETSVSQQDK